MQRIASTKRFSALAAAVLVLAACSGEKGDPGPAGPQGPPGSGGSSAGTVAGVVTVAGTTPALPVAGVAVTVAPAVAGVTITTAADGSYSATLPIGVYTLTYAATNFTSQTKSVSVAAGQTATQNVALAATAKVLVNIAVTGTATPGAQLAATATVTPLDGSTVTANSASWTLVDGAPVTFSAPTAATTNVTLGAAADYKVRLFKQLAVSPLVEVDDESGAIGEDNSGTFAGGVKDQFKVQAINHFDVERTGEVVLKFAVTTSSGTYSGTATVATALPFGVANGTAQVAVGEPVIVHGKSFLNLPPVPPATTPPPQTTWNYAFTARPAGSTAAFDSATVQNPTFTPDKAGPYTITESVANKTLTIIADTWTGEIDAAKTLAALGANGQGNAVGPTACTACHAAGGGGLAPDMFTPWAKSGHSKIFSDNVNAGGHYSEACFDCHTVGWNKSVANGGSDEASDYGAMLAAIFTEHGSPAADPLNWKKILTTYPNTAAKMNIQCENCHGPGESHFVTASADRPVEKARRVSMDAGVCARCHGEPARHGRYQEWQISGHANFETAIGEGLTATGANANCAGCHTAQGALLWFDQLRGGNPLRGLSTASLAVLNDPVTGMNSDNIQPQTCAVCHDPHDAGTVSSLGTDAKLRFDNDTELLPAGFQAFGVGKGAMCITCHNSRNGQATVGGVTSVFLHEDGDPGFGTMPSYAAPHEACQGDVLMGRNAYFVQGVRSAHSNIDNTCTTCHMESVPADPAIGYPTQTNHTFEANLSICSKCHGAFDGAGVQASVEAELGALKTAIESALQRRYFPAATTVEFINGRTPQVKIDGGTATNLSTAVPLAPGGVADADAQVIAKANWNYSLVEQDFSKGVHNPSFAHDVLFATTQKVKAIPAAPPPPAP